MVALLDVNALVALVDSEHVGYEAMHQWFAQNASQGWATCPLTENGMVRVLSQPSYPSGQRTPAEVIRVLSALKSAYAGVYQFWSDDVSISDDALFAPEFIISTRQVTDAYLLGLASRHKGAVVSFDKSMPWQAVRNGTRVLIQSPSRHS